MDNDEDVELGTDADRPVDVTGACGDGTPESETKPGLASRREITPTNIENNDIPFVPADEEEGDEEISDGEGQHSDSGESREGGVGDGWDDNGGLHDAAQRTHDTESPDQAARQHRAVHALEEPECDSRFKGLEGSDVRFKRPDGQFEKDALAGHLRGPDSQFEIPDGESKGSDSQFDLPDGQFEEPNFHVHKVSSSAEPSPREQDMGSLPEDLPMPSTEPPGRDQKGSLDESASTLESVSVDGSFQSGDTQVLTMSDSDQQDSFPYGSTHGRTLDRAEEEMEVEALDSGEQIQYSPALDEDRPIDHAIRNLDEVIQSGEIDKLADQFAGRHIVDEDTDDDHQNEHSFNNSSAHLSDTDDPPLSAEFLDSISATSHPQSYDLEGRYHEGKPNSMQELDDNNAGVTTGYTNMHTRASSDDEPQGTEETLEDLDGSTEMAADIHFEKNPQHQVEDGAWTPTGVEANSQGEVSPDSAHPDYPINYNNYKVCRQVEPGLKECLILETGEHVKCDLRDQNGGSVKSDDRGEMPSGRENLQSGNMEVIQPCSPNGSNSNSSVSPRSPGNRAKFKIAHNNKEGALAFGNLKLDAKDDYAVAENGAPKEAATCPDNGFKQIEVSGKGNRPSTCILVDEGAVEIDEHLETAVLETSPRGSLSQESRSDISGEKPFSLDLGTGQDMDDLPPVYETESDLRLQCQDQHDDDDMAATGETRDGSRYIYDSTESRPTVALTESDARRRQYYDDVVLTNSPSNLVSDPALRFPVGNRHEGYDQAWVDSRKGGQIGASPSWSQVRDEGTHDDNIDMSALYRAERWLGDKEQPVCPRRQNLSASISSTGSGPIPGFRTLQEQQASWMKMFKLLENQHQTDLMTQYQQHQRNIQRLQHQIEDDLSRQQNTFQQKLDVHREILLQNASYAGSYIPIDNERDPRDFRDDSVVSGGEHRLLRRSLVGQESEHGQTRPTASPYQYHSDDDLSVSPTRRAAHQYHSDDDVNVSPSRRAAQSARRSLEQSFDEATPPRTPISASRPAVSTSRTPTSASRLAVSASRTPVSAIGTTTSASRTMARRAIDLDLSSRVLDGGVYSSPLPMSLLLSETRSAKPARQSAHIPEDVGMFPSRPLSEQIRGSVLRESLERSHRERQSLEQSSLQHSPTTDDIHMSSNVRLSLREKHSKHLTDLRSYYEQELQELRASLSSADYIKAQSPYKQVMEENLLLQARLERLDEELNASQRNAKEMETKLHTMQVRVDDTMERYEKSQETASSLRHRYDDLRTYCKEKEAVIKDLEEDNARLTTALKESYKTYDQQVDEDQKKDIAIQRLTERHEILSRENESNKEALNQMDGKLYDLRTEGVQLKRMISKLELENNRLGRENDNLHHKGLISSLGLSTFYPSSPHDVGRMLDSGLDINRTPMSVPDVRHDVRHDVRPDARSDVRPVRDNSNDMDLWREHLDDDSLMNGMSTIPQTSPRSSQPSLTNEKSPLMKAEEDLRRLRQSVKVNLGQRLVQERSPRISPNVSVRGGQSKSSLNTSVQRPGDRSPGNRRREETGHKDSMSSQSVANDISQTSKSNHVTIIDSPLGHATLQRKDFSSSINAQLPSGGTPSRFDISFEQQPSPGNRSRSSPNKKKRLPAERDTPQLESSQKAKGHGASVENTLQRIKAGDFVTRPDWENKHTTTVPTKPLKTASSPPRRKTREERLEERVRTIQDLESKYNRLQAEKIQLESALSKVPLSGRLNHHVRKEKDEIDNRLDKVDRELGSVRMSLKQYHVLKSGH